MSKMGLVLLVVPIPCQLVATKLDDSLKRFSIEEGQKE